jgi:hypothetical protein
MSTQETQQRTYLMTTELELTYEDGEWIVWFATPFNNRFVLETFTDRLTAQAYYDEQVSSAEE